MAGRRNIGAWVDQQRKYYATRPHEHLQYSPGSVYANRLAERLLAAINPEPGSRLLEVGCGAGRFTIPLLQRFQGTLTGFDLSQELIERLEESLKTQSLPPSTRCELAVGDIYKLDAIFPPESFDYVVGFFFLHHLPVSEMATALAQVRRVLRTGGRALFVEPNRRNPLYLLQVMFCADMTWADEKGMFTLGSRLLRDSFEAAGFRAPTIKTSGFFPPQILDRLPAAVRMEDLIERIAPLRPLLPFRYVLGEAV